MALKKSLPVNANWMHRIPRGEEREAATEEAERADVEDPFGFAAEDAREVAGEGPGYECVFVASTI
jgi:hypothetical protein